MLKNILNLTSNDIFTLDLVFINVNVNLSIIPLSEG